MVPTKIPAVLAAAGVCLLTSGPVAAAATAVTGTGGGPETTITAPHTSASGQTLPPGAAAAPIADPEARAPRQEALDRVLDGVCSGCR